MNLISLRRGNLIRALMASVLIHVVLLVSMIGWLSPRLDVSFNSVRAKLSGRIMERAKPPVETQAVTDSEPSQVISRRNFPRLVSPTSSRQEPPAFLATSRKAVAHTQTISNAMRGEHAASVKLLEEIDGLSADDLRQYRMSLALAARRFKHYPALARERKWEGTVEVVVARFAHQQPPEVSILQTSGYELLDLQALEMVSRAADSAVLPVGLQGLNFRMILPLRFNLDDES